VYLTSFEAMDMQLCFVSSELFFYFFLKYEKTVPSIFTMAGHPLMQVLAHRLRRDAQQVLAHKLKQDSS
jgi:hypothetical protein